MSQQIPALFAPEPLLASVLALARTLLMFGLIGVGGSLGQVADLRRLGWGLLIVYATALAYSLLGSTDILISRLNHPYMTPITLGLTGAFGVWLTLFAPGKLVWRVPLGVLALSVLLLSGSRGPLAAALLGAVAGFMIRQGRRVAAGVAAGVALLAGSFYLGQRLEVSAITRLGSADTTGRDVIWFNTLSVIRSEPWSGVGSYRLGTRLASPGGNCELFASASGEVQACPNWVTSLGNPWLIAHNISLQQLAETGPLGLLGLFVLLVTVAAATLQRRDPLAVAVISGLLVATANDNTLLVPSPFFAEVFWVVAGMQLVRLQGVGWGTGVLPAMLLLLLSFPLLVSALPATAPPVTRLTLLNALTNIKRSSDYTAFVQFGAPPGRYRAVLRSCLASCSTISTAVFSVVDETSPVLHLSGNLYPVARQRLELLLYPGKAGARSLPIAKHTWTVQVQP
ncbi:O-antigen ligase family protein [Deinococcus deserti]|uniref:O-antigen ligase family protein n=1 Tax=Deinococcus deserti TaxID=310783 RepID=UPI000674E5AC|nr:O-antigen ligase family protein [Deinococcus deserti]